MASTYSTNLRLELIGTGEQQGTWGTTTNTNLGTLLEEAIGGYVSVAVTDGADTTLTTANGATDQSRNMTINLTGTLTAARNVICPAIEKVYIVKNATTGGFDVTFKVSGQTGVSVPNGATVLIYVDGTDARQAGPFVSSSNVVQFGAGSASAPSITAAGDTNTGIWFPTADTIAVSTGGSERLRINSAGNAGLGVTASAGVTLNVGKNLTGATTSFGVLAGGNIQSDVTVSAQMFRTGPNTAASAFTLGTLFHYYASQGTIGAGSTVSTQIGFYCDSSVLGATANYSFRADSTEAITSGKTSFAYWTNMNTATGGGATYAFYGAGTAPSYFGGNVGIGTIPSYALDVTGTTRFNSALSLSTSTYLYSYAGGTYGQVRSGVYCDGTNQLLAFYTGQNEVARVDSSGNFGVGTTSFSSTRRMSLYGSSSNAASVAFALTNSSSGTASTDGYTMELVGTNAYLWNYEAASLIFGTNNTEKMRIESGGNALVGKSSSDLTAVGCELRPTGIISSCMSASTNADFSYYLYSTGAGAYRFYIGLGGTVFATSTTISAISDIRFKENVRDLDVGLDAIKQLRPRKFDWKPGKGQDIKDSRGFIAQEFEQVFPDLVDDWADPAPEGEAPYKSIRQDLIPVLVKAIQELSAKNDALEARIAALEAL